MSEQEKKQYEAAMQALEQGRKLLEQGQDSMGIHGMVRNAEMIINRLNRLYG